ncbi:MAG: hypothetical protein JSV04_01195 [Candidatus Heimdallarchaeota archaeon]|nr:MAG: hypothetical protein JSV04_01195 [Candidatus Heimdallarchaeota archaeon]
MKEFREIRKTCLYRENKQCTYWPRQTQCHFVACPLFSPEITDQVKRGIKKQVSDSIKFDVDDLDALKTTTQDLIQEARTNELRFPKKKRKESRELYTVEKPVYRMTCFVCGEHITDEKFVTMRDPSGVMIYLHSKGKCEPRREQLESLREEWLKSHTSETER